MRDSEVAVPNRAGGSPNWATPEAYHVSPEGYSGVGEVLVVLAYFSGLRLTRVLKCRKPKYWTYRSTREGRKIEPLHQYLVLCLRKLRLQLAKASRFVSETTVSQLSQGTDSAPQHIRSRQQPWIRAHGRRSTDCGDKTHKKISSLSSTQCL